MVRAALFLSEKGGSPGAPLAAAASALALLLAGCGGSDKVAEPIQPVAVVSSASGAFSLTTFPGDAQAGLRFADFLVEGDVVIKNEGQRPGPFTLRQEVDFEDPAAGARTASGDVGLRIVDTTGEGQGRELYRGPVAALDSISVGEIGAGASRDYAFKLTPRTPPRPSRLDLSYRWVPGGPGAPPADRPEPSERPRPGLGVRLRIPSEQSVLDTRTIVVFARCTQRCRLEARALLRAPARPPIDLPASAGGSSSPTRAARLVLRAPGNAFPVIRAALTRGPPVSVTLRVRATGGGGSALATERIRLKPVPDQAESKPGPLR